MKKIIFLGLSILLLAIVLVPGEKISAASVCCRGRCLPAGAYVVWRMTNDCNNEIKDWCGGSPYSYETKPTCAY